MSDFALFVCGIAVTLIAGMGVITSQVFLGYSKFHNPDHKDDVHTAKELKDA